MKLKKILSVCSILATAVSMTVGMQLCVNAETYKATAVAAGTDAITVNSTEKIINRSTSNDAANNKIEHELGNGFKVVLGKGGSTSDDSKCDYVDGTTVHFRAGFDSEKNAEGTAAIIEGNAPINRYIEFTPSVNGTLSVTCTAGGDGRWGIVKLGDDTGTSNGVDKSNYYCLTTSNSWTDNSTRTRDLTAGTTYRIFGKGKEHTFTDVTFTPDVHVIIDKLTASETINGDDGSVADVFYATFNANGSSANTVNVTVNNEKKSITTANMSGDAKICFGIVISYSDGDNKGYTPTFTFE